MQHALKHVERPGGSHTALDGKKNLNGLTMQYGTDGTWSQNQDTHCSNYGLILSLP